MLSIWCTQSSPSLISTTSELPVKNLKGGTAYFTLPECAVEGMIPLETKNYEPTTTNSIKWLPFSALELTKHYSYPRLHLIL